MNHDNETVETVRSHINTLMASTVRRRRVAVMGNDGYAVFFGQPSLAEIGMEISAGRQVDRSRMTVEFAGHCEKMGFKRSRASDNFSRSFAINTAELDTWIQWTVKTLKTFFDAESFETTVCLEDHPELDAIEIHKAMENLARERSWAARTGLYMMLVKRSFLVAIDEAATTPEDAPVISSIDTLGDRPVAAIFTTVDALDRFKPTGQSAVLMDGMSLFPLLLSLGVGAVRINPGTSPRGELYANEVQILVDGIKRLRH